jgi:hypothetical protein
MLLLTQKKNSFSPRPMLNQQLNIITARICYLVFRMFVFE